MPTASCIDSGPTPCCVGESHLLSVWAITRVAVSSRRCASGRGPDNPDNIVVAPFGDLIVCEDNLAQRENFVVGVTPAGRCYRPARNAHPGKREFAGACFSPDGRTMVVNVQQPGMTFAVWGPWDRRLT